VAESVAAAASSSSAKKGQIQAWIFALLWNLCSTPLLIMALRGSVERGLPTIVALLFPVAGAGLLIWAVRATLSSR
jgi:FtsH-binding integral membrane protein